jgi:hypothetical protein
MKIIEFLLPLYNPTHRFCLQFHKHDSGSIVYNTAQPEEQNQWKTNKETNGSNLDFANVGLARNWKYVGELPGRVGWDCQTKDGAVVNNGISSSISVLLLSSFN